MWLNVRTGFCMMALSAVGCAQPTPLRPSFHSDDVNERILAIRSAAEAKDSTAVPLLVDRLEDEDEAVRFFAILALEKITGQRLGYDYGHSEVRRGVAVERWRHYVQDSRRATSIETRDASGDTSEQSAASDF